MTNTATQKIKTGQEIVASFIDALGSNSEFDADIVLLITELHKQGKMGEKGISNGLETLRRKQLDEASKNKP